MHIVFVAPESAPFVKTGGLGEVMGALPAAIAAQGHRVTMFLPYYRQVRSWFDRQPGAAEPAVVLPDVTVSFADSDRSTRILEGGTQAQVQVYFVDCPEFFDRDGVYGPPGENYPDNALRYGLYCRAVLEAVKRTGMPDVFHVHDWQGAFVPMLLASVYRQDATLSNAATVFTVHNGGYQGTFPVEQLRDLLIPEATLRNVDALHKGKANPFAAALHYAAAITTVSPSYAEELQTPAYGEGLDAVYRARRGVFTGILNGIDEALWDPTTDASLAADYSAEDLTGKAECRRDLLRAYGLEGVAASTAVIGIVSRVAAQKGFDLIAKAMGELATEDLVLLLLGTGEPELEAQFRALADRYPQQLRVNFQFEEALSHKVQGGSDLTLMPSRYEPSGLVQMYSLRYGTVPVVRATGGLRDSVQEGDEGDGFVFENFSAEALIAAVRRALQAFQDKPVWQERMRRGMRRSMGWTDPARQYVTVYERTMAAHHTR